MNCYLKFALLFGGLLLQEVAGSMGMIPMCGQVCSAVMSGGVGAVSGICSQFGLPGSVASAIRAIGGGSLSYALCVSSCTAACTSAWCFDGHASTDVINQDGTISRVGLANLESGMYVRSVKEGMVNAPIVARVEHVSTWTGNFEFFQFELADGRALNVTSPHMMILCNGGGGNDVKKTVPANEVSIGDAMLVSDVTVDGSARCVEVKTSTAFMGQEKINIETSTGSFIVNDIFVTGICENNNKANQDVHELLYEYRSMHGYDEVKME